MLNTDINSNYSNKQKKILDRIFTTESVPYTLSFIVSIFILLISKQIFHIFGFISNNVCLLLGYVIGCVFFYYSLNNLLFRKISSNKFKSIGLFCFLMLVNCAFHKLSAFVLVDLVESENYSAYFVSAIICYFFDYFFIKSVIANNNLTTTSLGLNSYKLAYKYKYQFISSFIVTLVLLGFSFVLMVFPLGEKSILRMDLYHQYGPLFIELYDRITNLRSFVYSWTSGGGSSFLGNYFNYLSSPLSLFILLFKRNDVPLAITFIIYLKGALSAFSIGYYLRNSFKINSPFITVIGIFYALSGYYLAYYWNVMWLEGMILLPIIVLGIERIIDGKDSKLYIISLCVLLYSSYYMGFMVCLFSVIYFFAYYLLRYSISEKIDINNTSKTYTLNGLKNSKFINVGFRFGLSSIIVGLICCTFLLTIYILLQNSSATSDSFPSNIEFKFDIFDFISSHFSGIETTIRSSGEDVLPNIYSGISTLILVPLYVMNKKISIREKTIDILLLILLAFSFYINIPDFIWHAFHFPNDLPYRYSFIYVFVILIISFKSFVKIKYMEYRDIALIGMFWIFVVMYFSKNPTEKFSNISFFVSIAFIIIWTGIYLLLNKKSYSITILAIAMATMAFCETFINSVYSMRYTTPQSEFFGRYDSFKSSLDTISSNDDSFYRIELNDLDTRMDPCVYDYNGMSTFSSMAYSDYSQMQYSLGMYGNRVNSYTYFKQTPVYDLMYSIKYIIAMDSSETAKPEEKLYSVYAKSNDKTSTIYQNNYYLPIAYMVNSTITDCDNDEGNPFDVQSDFIKQSTGIENIFTKVNYIETETDELSCEDIVDNGTYYFTKSDKSDYGSISITFKAKEDGPAYIYLTSPEISDVTYNSKNDIDEISQDIDTPYVMSLGFMKNGEEKTINLDCSDTESEESYFEIYAYTVNMDKLDSAYDMLKSNEFSVSNYSDTEIEGTLESDYAGVLYTSIPYDESWHIYIDGKETKSIKILDSQLGAFVSQGEHTIKFKYTNKKVLYTLPVSLISFVGCIVYSVTRKRKKIQKD